MGAKDTVISNKQVEELYGIHPHQLVPGVQIDELKLAQAEISFKAGIREVVEYVTTYLINGFPNDCIMNWQAKLKEWGIEM